MRWSWTGAPVCFSVDHADHRVCPALSGRPPNRTACTWRGSCSPRLVNRRGPSTFARVGLQRPGTSRCRAVHTLGHGDGLMKLRHLPAGLLGGSTGSCLVSSIIPLPNADPDADDLNDWRGNEFNEEYAADFSNWSPQRSRRPHHRSTERRRHQRPPSSLRPRITPSPPRSRYRELQRPAILLRQQGSVTALEFRLPPTVSCPLIFRYGRVTASPAPSATQWNPQ